MKLCKLPTVTFQLRVWAGLSLLYVHLRIFYIYSEVNTTKIIAIHVTGSATFGFF